ncbi:putative Restriction endonuclease type II NotI domain-containing protein [uncultured Gammaproteobacteria bacterium]
MRPLRRFWSSLEQVYGLSAAAIEWRSWLGEDWDTVRGLLKPRGQRAATVSCPSPGGDGCPRRVVFHDDGRITAVCQDRPRSCETLVLQGEDVVALDVDVRKLAGLLGAALAFDLAFLVVNGYSRLWRLGSHEVAAGAGFPVFLTVQTTASAYHVIIVGLCRATDGPFLVLAATRRLVLPETTTLLAERKSQFLALGDVLAADGRGRLMAIRPADEVLANLRQHFVTATAPPVVRFPTPSGSRWEEVSIRFLTQEQVHVKVRHAAAAYEFSHMNMEDRRSNRPDAPWRLLLAFAENAGDITWHTAVAHTNNITRRQLLARTLQDFFGIDGDPFTRVADGKGWRCRFSLIPEI